MQISDTRDIPILPLYYISVFDSTRQKLLQHMSIQELTNIIHYNAGTITPLAYLDVHGSCTQNIDVGEKSLPNYQSAKKTTLASFLEHS
jgi:hypothetical protein